MADLKRYRHGARNGVMTPDPDGSFVRYEEAAAALEAAREDACVALVADIRFACGDNGKRMQPDLVEFIRRLAEDSERLDYVMRHVRGSDLRRVSIHTNGGDYRSAIDQARGKGGGEVKRSALDLD